MLPSNQEHNTIYRYHCLFSGAVEVSPLSPQRLRETWRSFGCGSFPAQAGAVPWGGTEGTAGCPLPCGPVGKGPWDCSAVSRFCAAPALLPPLPCWWLGGDSWVLLGTSHQSQPHMALPRGDDLRRCQQLRTDLPRNQAVAVPRQQRLD